MMNPRESGKLFFYVLIPVILVCVLAFMQAGCDDDGGIYPCPLVCDAGSEVAPDAAPPPSDAGGFARTPDASSIDGGMGSFGNGPRVGSGAPDGRYDNGGSNDVVPGDHYDCQRGIGRCVSDCVHRGYLGRCCVATCKAEKEALCASM